MYKGETETRPVQLELFEGEYEPKPKRKHSFEYIGKESIKSDDNVKDKIESKVGLESVISDLSKYFDIDVLCNTLPRSLDVLGRAEYLNRALSNQYTRFISELSSKYSSTAANIHSNAGTRFTLIHEDSGDRYAVSLGKAGIKKIGFEFQLKAKKQNDRVFRPVLHIKINHEGEILNLLKKGAIVKSKPVTHFQYVEEAS